MNVCMYILENVFISVLLLLLINFLIVLCDVTKDQTESSSTGTYVYVAIFMC